MTDGIALARGGCLLRGSRARRSGPRGRCLATLLAALVGSRMPCFFPAAGTAAFLATSVILVEGRPSTAFRFLLGNATLFVTFRNVVGLAFLLGFFTTGH